MPRRLALGALALLFACDESPPAPEEVPPPKPAVEAKQPVETKQPSSPVDEAGSSSGGEAWAMEKAGVGEPGGSSIGIGNFGKGDPKDRYGRGAGSTAKAKLPRVHLKKPVVGEPVEELLVRRVVRSKMSEVRACYEKGLAKNPALAGTVTISFVIDEKGEVPVASVLDSELADDVVAECIADEFESWTFPKPRGGGKIQIKYPLRLDPE